MIKKMGKEKAALMWTVLLIAAVQMPSQALTPAINQIHGVFSDKSLSTIQTVMQLPNFIAPFVTIISAYFIRKGKLAKKVMIVTGLFLVSASGICSIFFNTEFWHLVLLSSLLGFGLSGYISLATSLIVDNFSKEECQFISGFQTSFINGGGIIMSFAGGLLATMMWHGGYLMLILTLPIAFLAIKNIKGGKTPAVVTKNGEKKAVLPSDVYLYGAFIFFYMLVNVVVGSNLSTHMKEMGNTSVAGYATSMSMLGGVVCGLFFGKLSRKLDDYSCALAFFVQFIGMTILSCFPGSLPLTFVAVFICGTGMSFMLPQCMYSVSKIVNETNSAFASSITSCIAPSGGGFFSAMIFTNITSALYGDSTVMRYRFVSIVALCFCIIIFALVTYRKKSGKHV